MLNVHVKSSARQTRSSACFNCKVNDVAKLKQMMVFFKAQEFGGDIRTVSQSAIKSVFLCSSAWCVPGSASRSPEAEPAG